ncbi:MAG: hypothetical protein R3F37_04620 [Candidatus Competibacteraceae bacterium]
MISRLPREYRPPPLHWRAVWPGAAAGAGAVVLNVLGKAKKKEAAKAAQEDAEKIKTE